MGSLNSKVVEFPKYDKEVFIPFEFFRKWYATDLIPVIDFMLVVFEGRGQLAAYIPRRARYTAHYFLAPLVHPQFQELCKFEGIVTLRLKVPYVFDELIRLVKQVDTSIIIPMTSGSRYEIAHVLNGIKRQMMLAAGFTEFTEPGYESAGMDSKDFDRRTKGINILYPETTSRKPKTAAAADESLTQGLLNNNATVDCGFRGREEGGTYLARASCGKDKSCSARCGWTLAHNNYQHYCYYQHYCGSIF